MDAKQSNEHIPDTQQIEILGRNRLITELVMAGLEVAIPERDRGIDLIAYVDRADSASMFAAVPIQMKAASGRSFVVDSKYEKFSNLLLVFVWNLSNSQHSSTYALTYQEALDIAKQMKWVDTVSWKQGKYSTTTPSKVLCKLLEPHLMSSPAWRSKVSRVSKVAL